MTNAESVVLSRTLRGIHSGFGEMPVAVEIPEGTRVQASSSRFGSEAQFAAVNWQGMHIVVLANALGMPEAGPANVASEYAQACVCG